MEKSISKTNLLENLKTTVWIILNALSSGFLFCALLRAWLDAAFAVAADIIDSIVTAAIDGIINLLNMTGLSIQQPENMLRVGIVLDSKVYNGVFFLGVVFAIGILMFNVLGTYFLNRTMPKIQDAPENRPSFSKLLGEFSLASLPVTALLGLAALSANLSLLISMFILAICLPAGFLSFYTIFSKRYTLLKNFSCYIYSALMLFYFGLASGFCVLFAMVMSG